MINKNDILKLQIRNEIYNFIQKNPGLHFRELSRKLNIPKTTLIYHLHYLEKLDIVISKTVQGYKRFYIKEKVGIKDKEIINILRQEIPLRIVLLLMTPGPAYIFKDKETYKKLIETYEAWERTYSKNELIEFTKYWGGEKDIFHIHKHRTTVSFHLQKLLEADIIEKVKVGKETKYKLKDEDQIVAILIKYRDALSKKSIDIILKWKRQEYLAAVNKMENVIYEIFPHPYHV